MQKIGTTKLWIGELSLPEGKFDTPKIQAEITRFTEETRHTVTGAYLAHSAQLLLLHWPETRAGYTEESLKDCEIMQRKLSKKLMAAKSDTYQLPTNGLLCMMGLRVGGYTDGRIAKIEEIATFKDRLTMDPAHMVSARARNDGTTESYGEPTVLLQGSDEATIHAIGDQLKQHHYGIHRGSGTTDFYETIWAQAD